MNPSAAHNPHYSSNTGFQGQGKHEAEVYTAYDYYPFGSIMPERFYSINEQCSIPEWWEVIVKEEYEIVITLDFDPEDGEAFLIEDAVYGFRTLAFYPADLQAFIDEIITNGNYLDGFYFTQTGSNEITIHVNMTEGGYNCGDIIYFNIGSMQYSLEIDCDETTVHHPAQGCGPEDYRYGFNNMEKDNQMKGIGNSYDFGARIYDSRLGRWLSLDPLQAKHSYLSAYVLSNNNPIVLIDIDGRDFFAYTKRTQRQVIKVLNNTLGSEHGFSFNENNQLIHNGSNYTPEKVEQAYIHSAFLNRIVNNENILVHFRGFNRTYFYLNDEIQFELSRGDAFNVQQIRPGEPINAYVVIGPGVKNSLKRSEKVKSNRETVFWHEAGGHSIATLIYGEDRASAAKWTVGFENVVRNIFGLPQRSGNSHNATIRDVEVPGSRGKIDIDRNLNMNFDIRPGGEETFNIPDNQG